MKLTDSQKHDLFLRAYSAILNRPTWPTTTPPAKDGTTKTTSQPWAVACWAAACARAAVAVLEAEDAPKNAQQAEQAASVPF